VEQKAAPDTDLVIERPAPVASEADQRALSESLGEKTELEQKQAETRQRQDKRR